MHKMPLVKVKTKFQVTLPNAVREMVRVEVGDLLEARVEGKKITLTPQSVVDREIAEGLEDIRQGRVHGPYKSAEEMVTALHRMTGKTKGKTRKQK